MEKPEISAEIRWFWPDTPPPGLEDWFRKADSHGCEAGGGHPRKDMYVCDPDQTELGLKYRSWKDDVPVKDLSVQVKGLIDVDPKGLGLAEFAGPVEVWGKWTSELITLKEEQTVVLEKLRWLRKFNTAGPKVEEIPVDEYEKPLGGRPLPSRGCNLEFTRVRIVSNGKVWWTFGLEAFGTVWTVLDSLKAVSTTLIARRPPALGGGLLGSYPAWLKEHVQNRGVPPS